MKHITILSVLALAACSPPMIVDYNGDSVRIQSSSSEVTQDVWADAQRICRDKGFNAEYASSRTIPATWETVHLFLCLRNPKPNGGLPASVTPSSNYLETTASL